METKKSIKADLERKKGIFFQIGLVVALSLVFFAFEWKSYNNLKSFENFRKSRDIPEDLAPLIPNKPPEPPKKVFSSVIEITKTAPETNLTPFNIETNPNEVVTAPELPESKPEARIEEVLPIILVPEISPSFPGGEEARNLFMKKNIVYPELAKELGIKGKVIIQVVVERDGSLSNFKILKGIGGGCDEEALRVVKLMPNWIPGKQNSVPARVQLTLPILFTLN